MNEKRLHKKKEKNKNTQHNKGIEFCLIGYKVRRNNKERKKKCKNRRN
jgi:hypothetical protein